MKPSLLKTICRGVTFVVSAALAGALYDHVSWQIILFSAIVGFCSAKGWE
jgi:hypothetical protein